MKRLTKRNYELVRRGVSTIGSYDPEEIFFLFEEELYCDDCEEIWNFLAWVHNNDKRFGSGNYNKVFDDYLASKN